MEKKEPRRTEGGPVRVHFAGLEPGAPTPVFAVYETDVSGRPLRKLAVSKQETIDLAEALAKVRYIGLGPEMRSRSCRRTR
jgi:hypothetical protein